MGTATATLGTTGAKMTVDLPGVLGAIGGLLGGASAVYVAARRRAIEKYVAELDRVSYEHEVIFSRLHERRVDVIADLYHKLVDAEIAFGSWLRPLQMASEPTMIEKADLAAKAGEGFQTTFFRERIWLDEDLCEHLDALTRQIYEAFVDFTTYKADDPNTWTEYRDTWKKAWDKIDQDVPSIRREIEARFREMLGVVRPTPQDRHPSDARPPAPAKTTRP
jgi:hypothetical protein